LINKPLNVNTHYMNVVVGIKRNVIATEIWVNGGSFNPKMPTTPIPIILNTKK
jgi:hypothetical protein